MLGIRPAEPGSAATERRRSLYDVRMPYPVSITVEPLIAPRDRLTTAFRLVLEVDGQRRELDVDVPRAIREPWPPRRGPRATP